MNNYNNDRRGGGGFNKNRGGGDRGGYGGGRPKFGGDRNGGGRGGDRGDRPMQLHKATCATCGKLCEVPFKPTGDKPVYCSDCFKKQDGGGRDFKGGDRGERSFDSRPKGPSSIRHEHPNDRKQGRGDEDINKRLMTIESKLNRILDLINPPQPPVKKIRPVDEAREERKAVNAPALKAAVESVLVEIKEQKLAKKVATKEAKPAAKKVTKKAASKKK